MPGPPTNSIAHWSGDEWEKYAKQLLRLRHADGDFQDTPSEYRGDCGLDGFSPGSRCAYQCYAAVEPLTHLDLHDKQRNKIRVDTQKLIDRASDVGRILGNIRLKIWTLVVPRFSSTPLLGYCSERAKVLRDAGLAFIDEEFRISIESRESFDLEESVLLGEVRNQVRLEEPRVSAHDADRFSSDEPAFLTNLREKLECLIDSEALDDRVQDMIMAYLRGANIEEGLRTYAPLYEEFRTVRSRRQASLSGLSSLSESDPSRRLESTVSELNDDFDSSLPALRGVDRDALTESVVIGWLGQCPLRLE